MESMFKCVLWVKYAIKSLRAKLSSFEARENSRFLFQNLESLIPIIHESLIHNTRRFGRSSARYQNVFWTKF